jgi:hypothetical protein
MALPRDLSPGPTALHPALAVHRRGWWRLMPISARFARSSRSATDTALLRARKGYFTWLDHIWSAAGCTHPVHLYGDVRVIDPQTGELLRPCPPRPCQTG